MNIRNKLKSIRNKLFGSKVVTQEDFRVYERSKAYIRQFLPDNLIIIEAGAHIGTDTVDMARQWPDATIHAFEPFPDMYKILKKNTKNLPNVILHKQALSNKNGTADFYVSQGTSDASSSLLAPKVHLQSHPTVTFKKKIKVITITLDAWAKKQKIDHVDFMWLDMQGMESKVLKASKKILPTAKLIYTEVSIKELYKGVDLYPQFKLWMYSKGFYPKLERLDWEDCGDVLFMNINK